MSTKESRDTGLTPEQQALSDLWDEAFATSSG